MGHANLSNLSEVFINLLYAKGRLTIGQAIETAVRRGEKLQASEGEYDDDGTLGMGFMDIIAFLHSDDGRDYSGNRNWEGPWIVPDWDVCKPPKGASLNGTVQNLLKQCRAVDVAYIPICPVWEQRALFGVCADAVQEAGYEEWAELIRGFPKCYRSYVEWKTEADNWFDGDAWEHFDKIRWVFAPGWRKRYREVPLLGNVTH